MKRVDTRQNFWYAQRAALVDLVRYYEGFVLAKKVDAEVEAPDPFVALVQSEIEAMLKLAMDPAQKDAVKEKNITVANAIKFIMVRNKINGTGDDDGFWGN